MRKQKIFLLLVAVLVFCFGMVSTVAANDKIEAGQVIFVLGQAVAKGEDGKARELHRKSIIFEKDVIITNNKSQVQLRFTDNGFVSIRPNSTFKVEGYSFNSDNPNKEEFELIKGGFRAITGQIGKANKKAFKLRTPVATLGIRGTDFTVMFCQHDCGSDFRKVTSGSVENGLYIGVVSGGVDLANRAGKMLLSANQYGFIKNLLSKPKHLPRPPAFLMFDRTERSKPLRVRNAGSSASRQVAKRENQQTPANSEGRTNQPAKADTQSLPTELKSVAGELLSQASLDLPELQSGGAGFDLLASVIESRYGAEANSLLPGAQGAISGLKTSSADVGASTTQAVQDVINTVNVGGSIGDTSQLLNDPSNLFSSVGSGGSSTGSGGDTNIVNQPDTTVQPPTRNDKQAFALIANDLEGQIGTKVVDYSNGVVSTPFTDANRSGQTTFEVKSFIADTTNTNYFSTQTEYAFDSPASNVGYDSKTGLSWGRYASGNVSYEKENGSGLSAPVTSSIHWVAGAENSILTSVDLPKSGTAQYYAVGNTLPTDDRGNTGSVLGQMTLTANFGASSTVDADFTLNNFGNEIWSVNKKGMPLDSNGTFVGLPNLAADNTEVFILDTSSNAYTYGTAQIQGFFVGSNSGNAPNGAAMVYELKNSDPASARVINGSAAFRRSDL